jgi:hypothetical protein
MHIGSFFQVAVELKDNSLLHTLLRRKVRKLRWFSVAGIYL